MESVILCDQQFTNNIVELTHITEKFNYSELEKTIN